jgi:hypothetical protein
MELERLSPLELLTSAAQSGVGPAFRFALDRIQRRAFKIALDEIRSGNFHPANIDPDAFAGMLYCYGQAAMQGAAKANLRILARLMASICNTQDLIADDFIHLASVLAPFRREELVFLVALDKHETGLANATNRDGADYWEQFIDSNTPHPFESREQLRALAQSVSRSGFIVLGEGWGVTYVLSPIGIKILQLARIASVLKEEGQTVKEPAF